jgi:cholest-4-en-3-one 26-monooxygenase
MTQEIDLEKVCVLDREHWRDGPPHELFEQMRGRCPVHWTERISEHPFEAGFWSLTKAADTQAVCRDWRTFSSERGGFTALTGGVNSQLTKAMFIAMDPPKHDRLKALFQTAFTPRRIADHEDAIRAIVVRTLERAAAKGTCDLVSDVATPVVSRVIGSFMGIPEEDDATWAKLVTSSLGASDRDLNPEGMRGIVENELPEIFARCSQLIAARRAQPTDDLTSVLVHAEIDGKKLEEHEIIMGFFLLMVGGNDSTKATYCSGMRALMENPEQRRLLLEDPSLVTSALEESLRMFPAFPHFRRTATCDTKIAGQKIKEGEKVVMWFASSNRDEDLYEDPNRFDVTRNPEHQAFGGGGRHYCLGAALARLELRVLFEETMSRFPNATLAGEPTMVESAFINQPKTLPVRLAP